MAVIDHNIFLLQRQGAVEEEQRRTENKMQRQVGAIALELSKQKALEQEEGPYVQQPVDFLAG